MWRGVTIFVLIAGLLVSASLTSFAAAASKSNSPGGPDLKTTLEKGLKARRPVEFQFIALVVHKVDNGTLPASLVNSTFLWARQHRPWPFPYFERGLRERAKKAGISI